MGTFAQKMNLANFTCTFGEKYVLLDMFDEVVSPAFTGKHTRTYSDSTYFLLDVGVFLYDSDEVVVSGRIVKNTTIGREQLYRDGKIVADRQQIESAPTSFFVLRLSDHKSLYVRENSGAPGIGTFSSTISAFIKAEYRKWIRIKYDEMKKKDPGVSWKNVYETFPPPSLEVTPMATESSVTAFLEKFKVINTVEVRLLETNHELDNSPIFGNMRRVKSGTGAESVVLRSQKAGDVGLDKGGVSGLISSPAEEGNSRIVLRGKDLRGTKLVADNESLNVAVPIKKLPESVPAATDDLLEKLLDQIAIGVIKLKDSSVVASAKLKRIISSRTWQ
jgi:hypothetical protein